MTTVTTVTDYSYVVPDSGGDMSNLSFGQNIAVSDSYMAVSAIRHDSSDSNKFENSGAIYLYSLDSSGLPIEGTLRVVAPTDGSPGDLFGDPLKIVGSSLVTSSFASGAGKIYIYDLEDPGLGETILTPQNGRPGDRFGCSFDMTEDGQFLFVGALGSDEFQADAGAVYCYTLTETGYELYHILEPPRAIIDEGFGRYIEVAGDQLIVSSMERQAVYVFDLLTLEVEDVVGSVNPYISGFGVPIDVYEDVMVIGARESFRGLGCAFVYYNEDGTNWVYQGLVYDESFSSMGVGISVSVDDEHIAVSPRQTFFDRVYAQGSVVLYDYAVIDGVLDLTYNSTIAVDNGDVGDFFGKRVTLDNGNLYSTALYDDTVGGVDSGSVYVLPV